MSTRLIDPFKPPEAAVGTLNGSTPPSAPSTAPRRRLLADPRS